MIRDWVRRTTEVHDELAAIAELGDRRWWLLAGGAALPWPPRATYVMHDDEPSSDTFIGHTAPAPVDPIAYAVARAYAARAALSELDGELPDQPLAVTLERTAHGAVTRSSALDTVALAHGDQITLARLVVDDGGPLRLAEPTAAPAVPFVTISLGDEPIETAHHGHRRGWATNGVSRGPWLGLSHAGGMAIASTCHIAIDGFGHAWLSARIAEHTRRLLPRVAPAPIAFAPSIAPIAAVPGAVPLAVAWRTLAHRPRVLPIAYAAGIELHRLAGRVDAPFSPTLQIPVAVGSLRDPQRRRRRHVPAMVSVRFDGGRPEPFAAFASRARAIVDREAEGRGLTSRLLAAAQAVPVPLAWKRRAIGAMRPPWLERLAQLIGGRGLISRIRLDTPAPLSCAVSCPSLLRNAGDPLGGCVVTVVDDGAHAAITLSASGLAASHGDADRLLDEVLARVPEDADRRQQLA